MQNVMRMQAKHHADSNAHYALLVYTDSGAVFGIAERLQHRLGVFMETTVIAL